MYRKVGKVQEMTPEEYMNNAEQIARDGKQKEYARRCEDLAKDVHYNCKYGTFLNDLQTGNPEHIFALFDQTIKGKNGNFCTLAMALALKLSLKETIGDGNNG